MHTCKKILILFLSMLFLITASGIGFAEETEQTPEEPVFSDERPAEPEPTTFPKQYDERELRRFNARRTHAGDEEDNTI